MNMFAARLAVMLANEARSKSDLAILNDPSALSAKIGFGALNSTDVTDKALDLLNKLPKSKSVWRDLLVAFWDGRALSLPRVSSRLLVNPPGGVDVNCDYVATLGTELGECYNRPLSVLKDSPLERVLVTGDNPGYFDDVVVFWDGGVVPADMLEFVTEGSTVTLLRPARGIHGFWVR